jgi:hypothetical protein
MAEEKQLNKQFEAAEKGKGKTPAEKSGFVHESEDERLLRDIFRSDLEKLQLFTKMIRRNRMFKNAGF